MSIGRTAAAAAAAALALLAPARAQGPLALAEEARPGDCSKYLVESTLSGRMVLNRDGQKDAVKLEGRARHRFAERTLAVEDGLPRRSARHYEEAQAKATAGANAIDRTLSHERAAVVAERRPDGVLCYSPAGPLTREELDAVAEHFDPQCLPGLLPGKAASVGDSWKVGPAAAQAACLFDALVKADLTGRFVGLDGGRATFAVGGTAEGIEGGAPVKIAVSATGTFDPVSRRVVALRWTQKDERGEGPIGPASEVEATVTVTREVLAAPPAELGDAAAAPLAEGAVPVALTRLRYADPKGRYRFDYPREWHVTGQTDAHLILRLLDRGELLAQATVSQWKRAAPGGHDSPEEFKKAVAEVPGWLAKEVVEEGELAVDGGRWLYRVTAVGEMEGLPVLQGFHLLAGPGGQQLAITAAMKPEKAKAVAAREIGLATAVEFPADKK